MMLATHGSQYSYDLGDYRIGIEIGRGSFAMVYKGVKVKTGTPVAIKSVLRDKLDKRLLDNLESEISILKTVNHPHIVSLLDYKGTSSNFYIIMEYCSLGDLSYFVRKKEEISNTLPLVTSLFERYPSPSEKGLHETLARHFIKQLVSALKFMRERNLIHRDIKPQNLLLCPPKKSQQEFIDNGYQGLWELPILKVADFGFARFLPNTSLAETLCGSPLYMAPEILKMEKYDAKSDLWSVGAVAYEMITGKPPFSTRSASHKVLLDKIKAAADVINFPKDNHASPEMRSFIRGLLKQNSTERMSYAELFNHPIVVGDIETESQPLDQSKLDENLFISEYIQAIPAKASSPDWMNEATDNTALTIKNRRDQTVTDIAIRETSTSPASLSPRTRRSPPFKTIQANTNLDSPSPNASFLLHMSNTSRTGVSKHYSLGQNKGLDQEEYVVVEKRTVEVNALADELAFSPAGGKTRTSPVRAVVPQPERRMSIGYGSSPTNALTRALSMASARLFGTRVEASGITTTIAPPQFTQRTISISIDSEERKLIKELENLATKGKVVSIFAEVKFSQLCPLLQTTGTQRKERVDSSSSNASDLDDNGLVFEDSQEVAEETLVLYMKTLSILAKAMERASTWWKNNDVKGASVRLNDIVQWIRERFNDALERAEYAQQKLDNIRKIVANRIKNNGNDALQQQSSSNRTPITAEKLIFDRAMEMSRQAAVDELLNQDLPVCEVSYGTAVWMLEALRDSDRPDDVLNEDDRAIVDNFIVQISYRLSVLRKKLDATGESSPRESPSTQFRPVIGLEH